MSEPARRRALILAFFLVPLMIPATERPAAAAEPACLDGAFAAPDAATLARIAVRILARSGHDPGAYRLELRIEDARHPDFPTLGTERVASVRFVPAAGDELYPLRVHPVHPCRVGWVWRPEGFTPWQRRVVERAGEQARATLGGSFEPRRVRVVESADLVGLELFGPSDDEPLLTITLGKQDLAPAR